MYLRFDETVCVQHCLPSTNKATEWDGHLNDQEFQVMTDGSIHFYSRGQQTMTREPKLTWHLFLYALQVKNVLTYLNGWKITKE